jgi:thiamine biosynthesis lipoprotein
VTGHARPAMDTLISITAPGAGPEQVESAFDWFDAVEQACSRFRPDSEVSRLGETVGRPVPVSPLLAAALAAALDAAEWTGGVFDPTVGAELAARGLDTDWRTGTANRPTATGALTDVHLDLAASTVTLDRPVSLDLGAVAKGLAVDLAGHELAEQPRFAINAGGDVLLRGGPWPVRIADPADPDRTLVELELADTALATSGRGARPGHLVHADDSLLGVSVLAANCLAADVLSTCVLLLGRSDGLDLLAHTADAEALLVDEAGVVHHTPGWPR